MTIHYRMHGPTSTNGNGLCGGLDALASGLRMIERGRATRVLVAAQFSLSDTAQAHLAVEKGDKLGTVIVDCAR